jgi:hypothetical protein
LSFNLRLLNLFFGMCNGAAGLPRGLYELGFRAEAVEMRFTNADNRLVAPELIIASEQVHHTVLFEWKSGANTEADQLQRYSRITTGDLVAKALLTPGKCVVHDIAVIGKDEHRERIPMGIAEGGYTFPALVATPEGLEIILNEFHIPETDAVFRPILRVNWNTLPTTFFPVDADSELWEFAEHAIPLVLQDMQNGAARILANDVGKRIVPRWETMRPDYQKQLEDKIEAVIDQAARREFGANLRKNARAKARTHTPTWDVLENPLLGAADKRQRAWKAMLRQHRSLIAYFKDENRQEELPLNGE